MTPNQEMDLRQIFTNCTGYDMDDMDYFEGERFSMWGQAAKKKTTISDAT